MKMIFVAFFISLTTMLCAAQSAVEKADAMVKEITMMREHYEHALNQEKQKNKMLQEKLDMALEAVESLRNQIKSEIKSQKVCKKAPLNEENSFPKLKTEQKSSTEQKSIVVFKAAPFRLKNEAKIYDNFENPNYITTWEAGRSFTSNQKTDGWIKITGYFVNRVWQPASRDLWVKEEDVIKRESK